MWFQELMISDKNVKECDATKAQSRMKSWANKPHPLRRSPSDHLLLHLEKERFFNINPGYLFYTSTLG